MRSQANTAKLLADSATWMRFRGRGVLEKVTYEGKRNVVLGKKGLSAPTSCRANDLYLISCVWPIANHEAAYTPSAA